MPLARGTQIGSFEILDPIGSGGMGEVYRGRDTKLGRDVAVKALPDAFAQDATRLARFEREAQALAALNHPNIAIIHDLKEVQGSQYLIMELVEGETLAEHIARGPVPIVEALNFAVQIAEALEAAHDKGVVHRDLKPANVKVTPEGRVKVLDFGLAKIAESASASNAANSPTLSALQTAGGVILGTAAYMSPEQARGKEVDRRADVWAFGCVLYEMLTSRQTFPNGETVSDTLAGILARDPDWRALPPGLPPKVRAILERCLRKDPERRLRDIGDARVEIEEARAESAAVAAAPTGRRRELVLAALASLFFITAVAGGARLFSQPESGRSAVRADIVQPTNMNGRGGFYLSPDGRKLAFLTGAIPRLIWVRPLEAATAQPIPSTDPVASTGAGEGFFWSPDSQHIGFVTQDGKLKRVPAAGGPAQELSAVPVNLQYYGTWSSQGVILLGSDIPGPLLRVLEGGGEPKPATELDATRKELSHKYPYFLPDGLHFLFLASGADAKDRRVYVGALDSKERQPLEGIAGQAQFANGHVVFVRDGALMAQPFDPDRLQLTGDAFAVANPVAGPTDLTAPFSVSTTGALSYRNISGRGSGGVAGATQLFWFDRKGARGDPASPAGEYVDPELSPDGKFVAFSRGTPPGIFLLEIAKQNISPVTSAKDDATPRWSPDGKTIAFQSARDGGPALYTRAIGVVGEDKLVFKGPSSMRLSDWSPDGKYLIYSADNDIWALPYSSDPKSGEAKPRQVTMTPEAESLARVSWDGLWIAYVVTNSQGADVWVQSFPEPGFKQKVSIDIGTQPRWNRNNRELFYYAPVFPVTVMSVSLKSNGSSLTADAPVEMVIRRGPGTLFFGIHPDGRFLLQVTATANTSVTGAATPAANPPGSTTGIHVILNWPSAFKR